MITVANIFIVSILFLYAIFCLWYTGRQKQLSQQEIDTYMQKLKSMDMGDEVVLARIRAFMESDTGKGFVMVNLLQLEDSDSAQEALDKYSNVFLRKLLRRAGHPIAFGKAASEAVEMWGIEDNAQWTTVGLIRYRSRRDLIEMVIDPVFTDIHPFKEEALKKTIAVPVAPWMSFSDLRLVVGLIATIVISLAI